jgi:porphobilinogen deaminase
VDDKAQADPQLKTVFYYAKISVRSVRGALITEKGYGIEELPLRQTIGTVLNRMGYRLKKHKKSNP